jgi:hypothetical protein
VDAGGPVTVTITADGYGSFGDVAETLPAGFTYSTSSLPEDQVTSDGETVTSPDPVAPGRQLTVTITAEGHGSFGEVAETLPAGFTYLSGSLPDDQVTRDGQTVTFALLGGTPPTTFTYTVTASSVQRDHSFTGVFSGVDADRGPFAAFDDVQVGGDSSITVAATTTPPASGPTASRSLHSPGYKLAGIPAYPQTRWMRAVR